jgi:hypothetical protein
LIRYFGNIEDRWIEADHPAPITLGDATRTLNELNEAPEDVIGGFVDENEQTLQFAYGKSGLWSLDYPLLGPNGIAIGIDISGDVTYLQLVSAVRAFFDGTDSLTMVFRQTPSLRAERLQSVETSESNEKIPTTQREVVTREIMVEHCTHCGFRVIGIRSKCPNCGAKL